MANDDQTRSACEHVAHEIAVTSSGLGGADSITALPHTVALGLPDALARRIARNAQLILLEESHLAKVSDPAAGSGAIEELTSKLCTAAWNKFQEIEITWWRLGVAKTALSSPSVASVRSQRQQSAARRKDAITGTSDYPNLSEATVVTLDVAEVSSNKEATPAIRLRRYRVHVSPNRLNVCGMLRIAYWRRPGQDRKFSWPTSEKSLISPVAPLTPKTSMRPAALRPLPMTASTVELIS